jgi:hypothetical protein
MLPLAVLSLLETTESTTGSHLFVWLCDLLLQSVEILLWKQNSDL